MAIPSSVGTSGSGLLGVLALLALLNRARQPQGSLPSSTQIGASSRTDSSVPDILRGLLGLSKLGSIAKSSGLLDFGAGVTSLGVTPALSSLNLSLGGIAPVGGAETAAALGAQGLGDVGAGAAGAEAGAGGSIGAGALALPFIAGAIDDPHFLEGSFLDLSGLFGSHTQGTTLHLPGLSPEGVTTRTAGGTQTALASFGEGINTANAFMPRLLNALVDSSSFDTIVAQINADPMPGRFRIDSAGPGQPFFTNQSWGTPFTKEALQNPEVLKNLRIQAGMMGAPADQPEMTNSLRSIIAAGMRGDWGGIARAWAGPSQTMQVPGPMVPDPSFHEGTGEQSGWFGGPENVRLETQPMIESTQTVPNPAWAKWKALTDLPPITQASAARPVAQPAVTDTPASTQPTIQSLLSQLLQMRATRPSGAAPMQTSSVGRNGILTPDIWAAIDQAILSRTRA